MFGAKSKQKIGQNTSSTNDDAAKWPPVYVQTPELQPVVAIVPCEQSPLKK